MDDEDDGSTNVTDTNNGMTQDDYTTPTTTTDDVSSYYFGGTGGRHFWNRILNFLIHSPRGLALLVSVATFVLIVMLGIFICFCVKCLRRHKNDGPSTAIYSTSSSFLPQPPASDLLSDPDRPTTKSCGRILEHKNIITPDRNIAFVVPTVPTHVQGKCHPIQHLTSSAPTSLQRSNSGNLHSGMTLPPMLETQFFPQFQFEETLGPQIGFSLSYNHAQQNLQVRILAGSNFPESGLSYGVHLKLYPGRGTKQRTREYTGSNPVYNYDANFHVRGSVLQTKVLKLRVIGSTPGVIGNNKSLLGVVNLAMKDIPMVNHNEVTSDFRTGQLWIELDHPLNVGDGVRLDVSLKWSNDPTPGLLVLKIGEAHGLHEITEADYTTTYVKVTLQEQGKSIKSRKTRLIRWGSLPDYDDTFVVTIPLELLTQVSFLLTLFARGRLGSKTILGKLHIGPVPDTHQSNPQSRSGMASGTEIWQDMLHQPNAEISRWLQLQP